MTYTTPSRLTRRRLPFWRKTLSVTGLKKLSINASRFCTHGLMTSTLLTWDISSTQTWRDKFAPCYPNLWAPRSSGSHISSLNFHVLGTNSLKLWGRPQRFLEFNLISTPRFATWNPSSLVRIPTTSSILRRMLTGSSLKSKGWWTKLKSPTVWIQCSINSNLVITSKLLTSFMLILTKLATKWQAKISLDGLKETTLNWVSQSLQLSLAYKK